MAKSRSKTVVIVEDSPVAETPASANIEQKHIAERAYELYVSRGCEEGHDLEDWLKAERELTASGTRSEMK
jgi:hypothetical protein